MGKRKEHTLKEMEEGESSSTDGNWYRYEEDDSEVEPQFTEDEICKTLNVTKEWLNTPHEYDFEYKAKCFL